MIMITQYNNAKNHNNNKTITTIRIIKTTVHNLAGALDVAELDEDAEAALGVGGRQADQRLQRARRDGERPARQVVAAHMHILSI
jgi:hypothetical protein